MLAQVIEPLLRNEPATFRPYDWLRREPGAPTTVAPADVVIIEGVGATRKAWRDRLRLRIWVDTDSDLRLRRGLERDGERARGLLARLAHRRRPTTSRQNSPQQHADLIVAGDPAEPHDAEREFVVLSEQQRAAGRDDATRMMPALLFPAR